MSEIDIPDRIKDKVKYANNQVEKNYYKSYKLLSFS